MTGKWLSMVASATLILALAGCTRPETPQQVAAEFWQALSQGDTAEAVELSTLTEPGAFDAFDRNWLGTLPNFGRIVIDSDQATIVTRIPAENGDPGERRELLTYLVRTQEQWLVDYQRTRDAVVDRPALSGLMSDIDRLGKRLDDAVGDTSDRLSRQIDQMADEFRTYSQETGKKAEEALENFGQSLEDLRQQIKEKLDEAQQKDDAVTPEAKGLEQAAI